MQIASEWLNGVFLEFPPFEINCFRFACIYFKYEEKKKNKGAISFIIEVEFILAHGTLQGSND